MRDLNLGRGIAKKVRQWAVVEQRQSTTQLNLSMHLCLEFSLSRHFVIEAFATEYQLV